MRTAIALLLLSAALSADDPPLAGTGAEPAKKTKVLPGEVEVGEPGTKIEDPAVARSKVSRFEEDFKAAKSDRDAAEVVKKLGAWQHPEILKVLLRRLGDRNRFVAAEAALACARQGDPAAAGAAIYRALQSEKREDVVCAQLIALGKVKNKKAYKDAEKWFRRDLTEPHKAAARYFGMIQAKEAFRMLAENLDYPRPVNVDDAKNPPESWWAERYKEWESNLPYVKRALAEIVPGETFDTVKEAKDWAEKSGKEHGIKW